MANDNEDSVRGSEGRLTRRNSLNLRESHEDLHYEEYEDEDFAGIENDGIQLGLLSRKPRAGKERAVDGANDQEITARQLAMSILGEVCVPFLALWSELMSCIYSKTVPTLMSTVIGMVFTGQLLETISVRPPASACPMSSSGFPMLRRGGHSVNCTSCT